MKRFLQDSINIKVKSQFDSSKGNLKSSSTLQFSVFDGGKAAVMGLKVQWWFGVSPEGFGSVAMLVNFIISFIVNRFTAPVPEAVQEIVENIRIPSGAGEASH